MRRAKRTRHPALAPAASGLRIECYRRSGCSSEGSGEAPCCVICMEPLDAEGHRAAELRGCGHAFHALCAHRWLGTEPSCPVCRRPVPAYEVPQGDVEGALGRADPQGAQLEASMDLCLRAAVGAQRLVRRHAQRAERERRSSSGTPPA